jgi:uncharacterized lipoprotein YehR (DUF1307 family)
MQKKYFTFILAFFFIFSLTGCSDNKENSINTNSTPAKNEIIQSTTDSDEEAIDFYGDGSGKSMITDASGNEKIIEESK